jgi:hypothetical protein
LIDLQWLISASNWWISIRIAKRGPPRIARVGRTLLSDAFDVDLDLAEDEREVCSTVEERRFSAA